MEIQHLHLNDCSAVDHCNQCILMLAKTSWRHFRSLGEVLLKKVPG